MKVLPGGLVLKSPFLHIRRMKSLKYTIGLMVLGFAMIAPAAPTDAPKVLLQEIKALPDQKNIIIPVKVEAKVQSVVSADIEGHITRILKPLGSVVKSGEIIMYLENKDPGYTYAAVPVRAPIAGVISQFWATQMAKVTRGAALVTIINPNSLKISAEFPSAELSVIKPGLLGQFKLESQKDLNLPIRVVGISPLVDSRTGTASAELEFMIQKGTVLPPIGSIGQASFHINLGSVLQIPEASLIYRDGKPSVRILKGTNQTTRIAVELGEQRDANFVVKAGVKPGDKVIVRSSKNIKDSDTVEIEKNPDAETKAETTVQ